MPKSDVTYELNFNSAQAYCLIQILDCYVRMGLGQMWHTADVLKKLHNKTFFVENDLIDTLMQHLQHHLTGYSNHASYGIGNQNVHESAHIAHEIVSVLQNAVAKAEEHNRMSVWHNSPLKYSEQPMPTCSVVE